jgi:hypothetical protein
LEQVAYSRVVEAFGNRDLAGILAYARAGGEKILWNPARKAVQLRNCSGELVIASLRVADADIAYIRSAVSAWSEIEPQ